MRLATFSLFTFLSVVYSLPAFAEPPQQASTINNGVVNLQPENPPIIGHSLGCRDSCRNGNVMTSRRKPMNNDSEIVGHGQPISNINYPPTHMKRNMR